MPLQNNLKNLKTNKSSYVPGPFIIVGSHCGAAVLRGADIFAPGMLGVPHGISSGKTNVNVYVDTKDKTLQGTVTGTINDSKYYSTSDQRNIPPHIVFIGKGICMMSRQELFQTKARQDIVSDNRANVLEGNKEPNYSHSSTAVKSGVAVKIVDCVFDCPSINEEYINDMYMLQNIPSIIAGHALMSGKIDSEQCEMILDMCAAPGGKTTHIASIISRRGQGKIIALDKSQNKINQIIKNCRRLGVEGIVETHVKDSTKLLLEDTSNLSDGKKSPIFHEHMFGRILLDAPCSALGQRPQFNISMKPKELASFPKLQRKLFDVAYKLLKPGGILVYSTCTFTIEENEGLVQWAKDKYFNDLTVENLFANEDELFSSDVEKHSKLKRLLNLGKPGVIIENGGQHSEEIQLARRFGLPRGKNYEDDENCDTIGFFVVKFRKNLK